MASIVDDGFRTDVDELKYLSALMNLYGMKQREISALSLVGFTAHALTDMNSSALYRSTEAVRESFVITASRLNNLYKHAREVDIFPTFSIPCTLDVVLIIQEKDFLAHATLVGDVYTYTITYDNFITVGGYTYSFDYNMEIRLEIGKNDERYLTANYIMNGLKNPISNLTNPTIKIVRQNTDTGYQFHMYLTLQQYHREYIERSFNNKDYGVFHVQSQRAVDYIAGMEVFHIGTNTNNAGLIKRLDKKMFFENSRTGTDAIFIQFKGSNQFNLVYKSDESGFRAQVGDILQTVLYMTTGSGAEFIYQKLASQNIKFNYVDDNPLYIKPFLPTGISSGGKTYGMDKEVLRKNIITKRSTRDSIIIENDLYMILNNLKYTKSGINEYAVIKNRNDIIKIFNIYTTLNFIKNNNRFTIPTNTLNVEWDFVTNGNEIDSGSKWYQLKDPFCYSDEAEKGIIDTKANIKAKGATSLKYAIPFTICYDKKNNIVRTYENHIDTKEWTEYHLLHKKVPYSFICNWVSFFKEDYDKPYKVSFEVRDTLSGSRPSESFGRLEDIPGTTNKRYVDTEYIGVYLVFNDKDKNEVFRKKIIAKSYTDINDDNFYTYEGELIPEGEDTLIKDDKLRLKNSTGYIWVPIENLEGYIEIDMPTERSTGSTLLDTNRQVINRFSFKFNLLDNRSKDYKIQHIVLGNNKIRVMHTPCVEMNFYDNHKWIFRNSLIGEYEMKEYISKYQGEFSYSIKFINSYGYSKLYTVGLNKEDLNNVMLKMNFIVERKAGSNLRAEELNKAVYTFINSIKFLSYDELHISKLYDYLFEVFPQDLKFIQFLGMNGLDAKNQLISMKVSEVDNNTIVEKLNLPIVYNKESGEFTYDINWQFQ
nr:MAG TPA: hypothetical protein [Caudoviricetes sp.]